MYARSLAIKNIGDRFLAGDADYFKLFLFFIIQIKYNPFFSLVLLLVTETTTTTACQIALILLLSYP